MIDSKTSTKPRLPWSSLSLLFLAYGTCGWLLYSSTEDRSIWLLVAFCSVILGGIVTYPSRSVAMGFGGFFRTDTRAFILIVGASLTSVLLLTRFQLFVDLTILFTAGLLASLDLKTKGWSKYFNLFVIVGWQLIGLSTGLALHHLSTHPIIKMPPCFYEDYWVQLLDRLN